MSERNGPERNAVRAEHMLALGGVLLVVLAGAIAFRSMQGFRQSNAQLLESYATLDVLDQVHLSLLDTQRAKRGFVISGDEVYLVPYRNAMESVNAAMAELAVHVAAHPEEQATFESLRTAIGAVFESLDQQITLRRATGFDPEREVLVSYEMERKIKDCRALLGVLRNEEAALAAAQVGEVRTRSARMLSAVALSLVSAIALLLLAAWRARVETRRRMEAESDVREKEERLALALEGGGLGTWDFDVKSNALTFNQRWAEMLGYRQEDLAPTLKTWEDLVHPDDLPRARHALERHLNGATPRYEIEKRLRASDGNWVWVQTVGKVISRDSSGNPSRICGTHLDVTDARTRADTLAAFTAELERSNRELDDFAYIASHDLKEPLRGIRNYAGFLIEDYETVLDASGQSKLLTLIKLADRLETFIEDLLRYSRVGRVALTRVKCDTGAMVQEVLAQLDPWLQETGAQVEIAPEMPEIECHPLYAAETFKNLIANAAKYNDKEDRLVWVGCTLDDGNPPVFFVRDNGIGIPEKHRESIFQIFKRLHGRDKFGGGSGAGLTIARKIVERHGGRIWLESAGGEGTTFFFTLSPGGGNE